MPKKFLRRDSSRHSKLGHLRKKLQKWRRPTGRDNKMREKRRGYPKVVSIGYSKDKSLRKNVIIIRNINDLDKVKNQLVIIGAVGKKNKMEIIKKAKEMALKSVPSSTKKKGLSEEGKIEFYNLNEKKFLKKIEKKKAKKDEKKPKKKEDKKIVNKIKSKDKKVEKKGEVKFKEKSQ